MKIILPSILTLLSLVSVSAAPCSQDLACSGFLGFGGYRLRSGYFDQCQDKCSLFFLAYLSIWWGGWECGACDGANEVALQSATVVKRSDVEYLASDELDGRDDSTPGGELAITYLVDELVDMGALGLNNLGDATGRDTYVQPFCYSIDKPCSSNVLAYIRGSELPNEYVVVGAHYDHFSSGCRSDPNADSEVCNGAMDNASGVAIALGIGRALAALATKPRRSVILAFWGAEEDGLYGSREFLTNPDLTLRPIDEMVVYINYDIQGANLSPGLRGITLVVGPETGGSVLQSAVTGATTNIEGLQAYPFSAILGQGRSDHASFLTARVPSVFFTDANNGCYHTTGDETKNVDFAKLEKQGKIGLKVAYELATRKSKPKFTTSLIPIAYDDAKRVREIVNRLGPDDLALFSDEDQGGLLDLQASLNRIVNWGNLFFLLFLGDFAENAAFFVAVFRRTECSGFLE